MTANEIFIPPCYTKWVMRWIEDFLVEHPFPFAGEFGLVPIITDTHIVFAVMRMKDSKMVKALKLERVAADRPFVKQMIVFLKCSPH